MPHSHEWHFETKHIGRRVLLFDRLDSTNNVAATLSADRVNYGVVIIADEQSAGRGRHGNTWSSPRGSGVWMSVLLFPTPELRRPAVLTAWAAVSICVTIRQTIAVQASIKWPNDVQIDGRKVCGILIEQGPGHIVAGVGLNVTQSASHFAEHDLPNAASLAMFTHEPLDRLEIARRLIDQLDRAYTELCETGTGPLEQEWRLHLGLIGQNVEVECLDRSLRGTLRDVRFECVELESSDGATLRLLPEVIRHIHEIGS
jgi:BirA family biotin operon repressor/biotin-[acetyl-CoA-carboxylase] ligase